MSALPPNTALQRTRSAPLRSPLSFETLGALKVFLLAAATFGMAACGIRYRVFVVEKGTPPGEIVVEVANPACPAALRTTLGVEIRIPKSGYTCVSIPARAGW